MRKRLILFVAAAVLFGASLTPGRADNVAGVVAGTGKTAQAADMQWFRDARFGLFVHWGPCSVIGKELSWSRGAQRRGLEGILAYPGFSGEVPEAVYDNLYRVFDPQKFNAKEWVELAKASGMKYIVFTSRHHDGFSMYDSARTDYKITNTPFGRDVLAELAQACHEAGMKFGIYYSQVNWAHPDWNNARLDRYHDYMFGQIRELCTKYGKVDIFWFDGACGTAETWQSDKLLKMIRELQPGIIINDRSGLPGDFITPEMAVGGFNNTSPWETCMTIGEGWSWRLDDITKSYEQLMTMLIYSAGGDGNFLLDLGPRPTGQFEPEQVQRITEMGKWLKQYGESVYGTRGGPFKPTINLACTSKGKTLYVHVLDWMGADSITLTPIPAKVVASSLLTGGKVKVKQSAAGIQIRVAKADQQKLDTVVKLELDTPASQIAPQLATHSGSAAYGKPGASSGFLNNDQSYAPAKAFDDNFETWWQAAPSKNDTWQLEVDLGKPMKIGRASLFEWCQYYNTYTIRKFELQYKTEGGQWKTFHQGTEIGRKLQLKFEPFTARQVRLVVLHNEPAFKTDPGLYEFQLFPPEK